MNWSKLLYKYQNIYPFLHDIVVRNIETGMESALPRVLKYSSAYANLCMEPKGCKRFCIQMPYRSDCTLWIALLSAFQNMRTGIDSVYRTPGQGFQKKQLLSIRNAIVQYAGIREFDGMSQIGVYYDSQTHWFPEMKFKCIFQRVDTDRTPSSNRIVSEALGHARQYVNNMAEAPSSSIEKILGFRTYGNKTLFSGSVCVLSMSILVDQFLNRYDINDELLESLILVGSINEKGVHIIRQPGQYDCDAQLLHTYDAYNLLQWIKKNKSSRIASIIVDGMDMFNKSLPDIDRIMEEYRFPLIVVCSDAEIEEMQCLAERNFVVWKWHPNALQQCGYSYGFTPAQAFSGLEKRISNTTVLKHTAVACRNRELEMIYRSMREIENRIRIEYPQFFTLHSDIMQFLIYINRMIWIPNEKWFELLRKRVTIWRNEIARNALFLSNELTLVFNDTFDKFELLSKETFDIDSGKLRQLNALISIITSPTVVVIPRNSITECMDYFLASLPENVNIFTYDDLLKADSSRTWHTMIICGWLRHQTMTYLLTSGISADIKILAYPWEKHWFGHAVRKWHTISASMLENADYGFLEVDAVHNTQFPKYQFEFNDEKENEDYFDEDNDDTFRKSLIRDANESKPGQQAELLLATMIFLADGWFMLATKDKTFLDVTPFVLGTRLVTERIPYRKLHEFRMGDWVLIPEADKDILRSIVDRRLEREGRGSLRETALAWKNAISKLYRENWHNYKKLHALLQRYGCKVTEQTVRGWNENNMIGPDERENIEIMARAAADSELSGRMDIVWDAICELRQLHIQAANHMIDQLRREIAKRMNVGLKASENTVISLDITEFGMVHLMQIDEIDPKPIMVDAKRVNHLYREEAMLRWQE